MAEYRDLRVPLTNTELDEFRHELERMPSYENGYISTSDFPEMAKRMNISKTKEELQEYIDYWNKHGNGRIHIDDFINLCSVAHRTSLLSYFYAVMADKNSNGFISKENFQDILKVMAVHDPKLIGKTYEDFLIEADSNKDGRVSLGECATWIEGYSASSSIYELSNSHSPFHFHSDEEPH